MRIMSMAASAIQQSVSRMSASAGRVAQSGNPDAEVDLAREAVTQSQTTAAVRANASVIRAADEQTATLLDILA